MNVKHKGCTDGQHLPASKHKASIVAHLCSQVHQLASHRISITQASASHPHPASAHIGHRAIHPSITSRHPRHGTARALGARQHAALQCFWCTQPQREGMVVATKHVHTRTHRQQTRLGGKHAGPVERVGRQMGGQAEEAPLSSSLSQHCHSCQAGYGQPRMQQAAAAEAELAGATSRNHPQRLPNGVAITSYVPSPASLSSSSSFTLSLSLHLRFSINDLLFAGCAQSGRCPAQFRRSRQQASSSGTSRRPRGVAARRLLVQGRRRRCRLGLPGWGPGVMLSLLRTCRARWAR